MLSAESLKQIDIELAKYPADQRRSAIMGALRIAQTEKGWLAPETIAFVADYIGITPAQAYEVATFYNMYDLEPVGKYKLTVCTNLPCRRAGRREGWCRRSVCICRPARGRTYCRKWRLRMPAPA